MYNYKLNKIQKTKIQEIIKLIKNNNKIAFFHHNSPDGDSFSSSYGFAISLKKLFPKKKIKVVSNDVKNFIRCYPLKTINKSFLIKRIDSSWLVIVGDVSIKSRINSYEEFKKSKKKIIFDHHQNNTNLNDYLVFWKEKKFIASTLQTILILNELKIKYNEKIALSLILGILTDSGFFKYSGNDQLPLLLYSNLIKYINSKTLKKFISKMFTRTKEKIKVIKFLYEKLVFDSKIAYIYITQKDLDNLNFKVNDFKGLIGYINNIENYDCSILFIDDNTKKDFSIKMSIRTNKLNIIPIIKKFNGGGHKNAGGATLKNQKEIKEVLKILKYKYKKTIK